MQTNKQTNIDDLLVESSVALMELSESYAPVIPMAYHRYRGPTSLFIKTARALASVAAPRIHVS